MAARGQHISGLTVDGKELKAAVVNENQVRAAAGLTMVAGAVAFAFAYFDREYVLLQVVSTLFAIEFLTRITIGIRYSPFGVLAHLMTRRNPPDWVSEKPKNFAWSLGLAMSLSMAVITNSGIRGWLPRSICLVCLTLMWMESVLGMCLGCKLHGLLLRRGLTAKDPAYEVCANGACEIPAAVPAPADVPLATSR